MKHNNSRYLHFSWVEKNKKSWPTDPFFSWHVTVNTTFFFLALWLSHIMTKPTKWPVRPAKTQISLGIRPVLHHLCVARLLFELSFCSVLFSLIRFFAVRMKKPWVLSYPMSAQQSLWSDWVDTQADLSLGWAHRTSCWFCHVAAHV